MRKRPENSAIDFAPSSRRKLIRNLPLTHLRAPRPCRPLARSPLIRSFPRSSVAAATLTVHLARSRGSIVEDFEAVLSQFATIAV